MKNLLIVLLLAFGSSMFLASCQKEEAASPAAAQTANDNQKQGEALHVYDMIAINHIAGMSASPDYSVTVNSAGLVTYWGHRNVATLGKKLFNVSPRTVSYLKELFIAYHFMAIKDDLVIVPDMALISTTYAEGWNLRARTLIDYDRGFPAELIRLRTLVEEELSISKFVKRAGEPVLPAEL